LPETKRLLQGSAAGRAAGGGGAAKAETENSRRNPARAAAAIPMPSLRRIGEARRARRDGVASRDCNGPGRPTRRPKPNTYTLVTGLPLTLGQAPRRPNGPTQSLLPQNLQGNCPKPSIPFRPSPDRRAGGSPSMASLFRSILRLFQAKAPGPELLDLSDDLLREILLRIGFPADVIRASAACVTFRRLVAEPSFFCRYRSLHPPLLLGFLDTRTKLFQPAEAPHPNAPAARALARTASFSSEDRLPRLHIVSYCTGPGRSVTSAKAASSSSADLWDLHSGYWTCCRSSRCATPCPGGACCYLAFPTTYSPPFRFSDVTFHVSRPSLSLLLQKRRMRGRSE